jgi:hypothetical protein
MATRAGRRLPSNRLDHPGDHPAAKLMFELNADLQDPEQFLKACQESKRHGSTINGNPAPATVAVDGLYCPKCVGRRRVDFTWIPHVRPFGEMPLLASMKCRQCHTEAHGLYYEGPSRKDLIIAQREAGGCSTPNTPEPVKFYLDQAARSEATSARSAAVAMYRAALEQLLHQQGFTTGMLNAKLVELDKQKVARTAPKWAMELDTEFLDVLKHLGNGAIHANGGDVKKQAAFDDELIIAVRVTFAALLDAVYEDPARRAARLAAMKSVAATVK